MSKKSPIIIFCDGSCNNGKKGLTSRNGGWGALLRYKKYEKKISGNVKDTSSSRMELLAVIKALECLKREDLPVILYSDSQYVIKGINEWSTNWIKKGWLNTEGKNVVNKDLWLDLLALKNKFPVITFIWVKGHSGHPEQEIAHHLAFSAYQKTVNN